MIQIIFPGKIFFSNVSIEFCLTTSIHTKSQNEKEKEKKNPALNKKVHRKGWGLSVPSKIENPAYDFSWFAVLLFHKRKIEYFLIKNAVLGWILGFRIPSENVY